MKAGWGHTGGLAKRAAGLGDLASVPCVIIWWCCNPDFARLSCAMSHKPPVLRESDIRKGTKQNHPQGGSVKDFCYCVYNIMHKNGVLITSWVSFGHPWTKILLRIHCYRCINYKMWQSCPLSCKPVLTCALFICIFGLFTPSPWPPKRKCPELFVFTR